MSTRSLSESGRITRYAAFAILATIANIASQECVIQLAPNWSIGVSIFVGTAVGFIMKYALDKWFVFRDPYSNPSNETWKISLYAIFSVLTTIIFWGFEIAAWWYWQTSLAKYIGAVVGLAIGYVIKYMLDQKLVFRAQMS